MYPSEKVAELVRPLLKGMTLEFACAHAPQPEALKRRLHDILSGKSEDVQEGTADDILTILGRPDLVQFL